MTRILLVIALVLGMSHPTHLQDKQDLEFNANVLLIVTKETGDIQQINSLIPLVFNGACLTDGEGIWITEGIPKTFTNENGDVFSTFATDRNEQKCRLWFLFKDKVLTRISIEYKDYVFHFFSNMKST